MKIAWKPKTRKKPQTSRIWHRWFAWYPVKVGQSEFRWLEAVERKNLAQDSSQPKLWRYRSYV